ncbi:uncharacterized protein [Misgurnus anguillicaudatus]|uniref:uncharacterized protein n=1 Tax=Misgurnus anguillicaudatus TaxID=75329 RepID=UPI003CCF63CF
MPHPKVLSDAPFPEAPVLPTSLTTPDRPQVQYQHVHHEAGWACPWHHPPPLGQGLLRPPTSSQSLLRPPMITPYVDSTHTAGSPRTATGSLHPVSWAIILKVGSTTTAREGTVQYVTIVLNEWGQFLTTVVPSGSKRCYVRMARGLVARFCRANAPAPKGVYVDNNCGRDNGFRAAQKSKFGCMTYAQAAQVTEDSRLLYLLLQDAEELSTSQTAHLSQVTASLKGQYKRIAEFETSPSSAVLPFHCPT